jgi:type I restriction-modification system
VKCIDDEIPFELPKGWEWCRLGTIFQTSSGTTPQSNNPLYYKDGDINWIRTTDLNNEILRNAEVKITEQACVDYKLKEVPINAVCIAMYGGAGTIGKHALIQFRTTINQSVCAIHPNIDCSSKFLHIFIQYQRPYWMDFAAGSRKDPNINQLIIQHCLFPLPPLAEQQRIVAKIEELMPLVEQYGKAQSELEALNSNIREQLKKSILQYAIEGKLVPQCEKDGTAEGLLQEIQAEKQRLYAEGKLKKKDLTHSTIFRGEDNKYYEQVDGTAIQIESDYDFPNTWAVVKLSHICRLIDGEKKEGQYICLDAKYLRGKSTGTYLDKGKFVAKGNNIILVDGENSGEVFTVPHDGYMGSTFKQLWVNCSMHLPYVLYFIQFYKDLLRNSKKGAAIPHLNKEFFYSLIIGIPPFQEQKRIANAIEELYARL